MSTQTSVPAPFLVLASSFYTASLEKPVMDALARRGETCPVTCVPYNQLHTFLLNPRSVIPEGTEARVVLLLRFEDLIRLEIAALGKKANGQESSCIPVFRERTEQLLDVLSRMSQLRLILMICPAGRGAYDIGFLENALRIAEHKVVAEIRGQQRHLVLSWPEFERQSQIQNLFNPSGDRLGHVPYTPEGLDALANFLCDQMERMPVTRPAAQAGTTGGADLQRFLESLDVTMTAAPLTRDDEEAAINLVRHTTHFVNWPGRKYESGDLRALAASQPGSEGWVFRVRDRFGDYGVSGAVTFGFENGTMRVGLLFLTCPVLGRLVEYVLFEWLAQQAELHHANEVEISFVRGRDNQGLCDLLNRLNGESSEREAGLSANTERIFRLRVPGLKERIAKEAPNSTTVNTILSKMQVLEMTA